MHLEVRAPEAGRVEVIEGTVPEPSQGQVRIAVERCGICGSDLHFFSGRQPVPPVCPGHEISGIVEAVGPHVREWREGDRVVLEPLVRCGSCRHCKSGHYHLCPALQIHGIMLPGGMATALIAPDYTLHRVPDGVGLDVAALVEPLAVTVHALRLAKTGSETPVLILGAGSVGLLAVIAARHLGAPFVAATGRHRHQREIATRLGANQVLEPADVTSVREAPTAIIETVGGTADTVADAVSVVDRGGTVAMVGVFDHPPGFSPLLLLIKEAWLVGSMIYNAPNGRRSDFDVAIDILSDHAESLSLLITHRFALSQVQQAFETAADKDTGAVKVVLDPTA